MAIPSTDASGKKRADLIATFGLGFTQFTIVIGFLLSVLINIADWLGFMETLPELRNRIPIMTLLLVSIVAVYLLQERKQEHRELTDAVGERDSAALAALRAELRAANVEQTADFARLLDLKGLDLVGAMKGVFVHQLQNQAEYYARLTREIMRAEKTVEDLTWGEISPASRTEDEEQAYAAYLSAIRELCRTRPSVRVREVFTFPSLVRVDRAQAVLNLGLGNYWAKYFDVNHAFLPPLMQFTIIDRKLVIFGTHRGALGHTEDESYVAIQHPFIAEKFANYFHVIWRSAKPLRDGHTENTSALNNVREKLEKKRRQGKG